MHDPFEWWAQIWLPAILGAATVLVSVVALWAAHRATVIARESEAAREREAEDVRRADLARRVLTEARDEARIALKWVRRSGTPSGFGNDVAKAAAAQGVIDADAILTQSLVPGAADLLWFLNEGVEHLWDSPRKKKGPQIVDYWDVIESRRELLVDQVRSWAADPEAEAHHLASLREFAVDHPEDFVREVLHPGALGAHTPEPANAPAP